MSSMAETAVWSGRSRELAGWEDLDPHSWVGAVQQDMRLYNTLNLVLPQAAVQATEFPHACVVMMVKDEVDVIGWNVCWLYQQGVRRFLISDNNSTDGTGTQLRELRGKLAGIELLLLEDLTVRYMQAEKMTGLSQLAQNFWPDVSWVLPIDADEFLIASNGLSILEKLGSNIDVLVVSKSNHYLKRSTITLGTTSAAANPFEKMVYRTHLGVQPPKVIFRAGRNLVLQQGNHGVRSESAAQIAYHPGFALGFYYREFQVRTFQQFCRRVANGGRAIIAAEQHLQRHVGGYHWKHWYDIYTTSGYNGLLPIFENTFHASQNEDFVQDQFLLPSYIGNDCADICNCSPHLGERFSS